MTFVYAIAFAGDEFVMVRNRRRSWEMPGGEVNPSESPEEAAKREFLEETSMEFDPISSTEIPRGMVFFGIVKVVRENGESLNGRSSEEIAEVDFFSSLPGELSFPRREYETMLQEGRIALKKYINRNSIGDSCAT